MAKATSEQTSVGGPAKAGRSEVEAHDPYGHGHSIAAWTAVGIVMLGSLICCLGIAFATVPVAVIGGVIALAGGPIGKILGAMGFGSGHGSTR